MLQADTSATQTVIDTPNNRPVQALVQQLDPVQIDANDPSRQYVRDLMEYVDTIKALDRVRSPGSANAPNARFSEIGPYRSVQGPALERQTIAQDALEIVRYRHYLAATAADRKARSVAVAVDPVQKANLEQTEEAVKGAGAWPTLKAKMAVINSYANQSVVYDWKKFKFGDKVDKDVNAGNARLDRYLPEWDDSADQTARTRLGLCIDSALYKMDMLVRAGVDPADVAVVTLGRHDLSGQTKDQLHAVTLVRGKDDIHVLDIDGLRTHPAEEYFSQAGYNGFRFTPLVSYGAGGINLYKWLDPAHAHKASDNHHLQPHLGHSNGESVVPQGNVALPPTKTAAAQSSP